MTGIAGLMGWADSWTVRNFGAGVIAQLILKPGPGE